MVIVIIIVWYITSVVITVWYISSVIVTVWYITIVIFTVLYMNDKINPISEGVQILWVGGGGASEAPP